MNRYDEYFIFRMARNDEEEKIMKFIGDYWPKKNHIFSHDKDFFCSEFCSNGKIDFYLAVDKDTDEIECCIGVYFYTKVFITNETDFGGGMYLANPNCKVPFIGAETLKRLIEELKPRAYIAPGANINTSGQIVIKRLKHKLSRMKHFYMLGNVTNFLIAKIEKKIISSPDISNNLELRRFNNVDEMYSVFNEESYRYRTPFKDSWYINKRYFKHPIYKYQVYGAGENTVLVMREVTANGAKAIRIIDILGDVSNFAFLGDSISQLLTNNSYEYVDLYELNMDEDAIKKAGFVERKEDDVNIIPNYFEPYECRNVEIYVHHLDDNDYCFKGDGDQDRPSKR